MQIPKACTMKASIDTCPRDIHREVREAFQGSHLHPTPKHVLSGVLKGASIPFLQVAHRWCPPPSYIHANTRKIGEAIQTNRMAMEPR